jgi:hypothetical protein
VEISATSPITDFTLFNVHIVNTQTMEFIDQGIMRARHAMNLVKKMDAQGVPCIVEAIDSRIDHDAAAFMEYMYSKNN